MFSIGVILPNGLMKIIKLEGKKKKKKDFGRFFLPNSEI
jgi:hypothetical protein